MKKIKLSVAILFLAVFAFGQSNKEDVDLIQAMFGKDKKEMVKAYMAIPEAQSAAFWTSYDAYEVERKAYGKSRIALIEQYAKAYESFDDKQASDLMGKKLALQSDYVKLQKKYFGKITKIIGAKQAAKLFQFEDYIENAIRISIQEEIPFIDELENTKK
jgi:hypothetical protein